MENNKDSSMSERDKKMRETFEVFDDSDNKKEKKKKDKKIPKRSLFLPAAKAEAGGENKVKSAAEEWVERQKAKADAKEGFLPGIVAKERSESNNENSTSETKSEKAESSDITDKTAETDDTVETVEVLDDAVITEAFEKKVAERIEAISAELGELDGEEEVAEATATADFVQNVADQLESGTEPEAAIDTALEEVVEEAEELPLVDDTDIELGDTVSDAEDAIESTEENDARSAAVSGTQSISLAAGATTSSKVTTNSKSSSTPSTTSVVSSASTAPPAGSSTGAGPAIGPNGGGLNLNLIPSGPNIISANTLNADPEMAQMNEFYYRRKNTGKVILSGLLGYAVGRRGGRKRTEARLQPEIDDGKQKVQELGQKLEQSEQAVREKVKENSGLQERASEAAETASKETAESKSLPETKPTTLPAETIAQEVQELQAQREKFAEQLVAEESSIIAPGDVLTPETVEKISSDTDRHESIVLQSPDKAVETTPSADQTEFAPSPEASKTVSSEHSRPSPEGAEKSVDTRTMAIPEVLQMAKQIDAGTGSLKDMYEQGRIDAVNLRKIVAEHAAGRNYEQLLSRSLEAEEMKHELRNEVKTASTMGQDDTATTFSTDSDFAGSTVATTTNGVPTVSSPHSTPMPSRAAHTVQKTQSPAHVPQPVMVNEEVQEYIRVSTPTAIALGVVTGGVFAAVLMLFII